jgi:dTDP-4-dehydrorhamnose reductase
LLHLSTDYVFDGRARCPYTEQDGAAPLGAYARSKLAGEQAVAAASGEAYVVRSGELYGHSGRNFFTTVLTRARRGEPLRVVDDQIVSPTWTRELAAQLVLLVERAPPGLYHATADGQTSWYHAACEALQLARLQVPIEAVSTEAYRSPTPRPRYSVLAHDTLTALGLYCMRPWQQALADWLHHADV